MKGYERFKPEYGSDSSKNPSEREYFRSQWHRPKIQSKNYRLYNEITTGHILSVGFKLVIKYGASSRWSFGPNST